jgi:hypothetical protein
LRSQLTLKKAHPEVPQHLLWDLQFPSAGPVICHLNPHVLFKAFYNLLADKQVCPCFQTWSPKCHKRQS